MTTTKPPQTKAEYEAEVAAWLKQSDEKIAALEAKLSTKKFTVAAEAPVTGPCTNPGIEEDGFCPVCGRNHFTEYFGKFAWQPTQEVNKEQPDAYSDFETVSVDDEAEEAAETGTQVVVGKLDKKASDEWVADDEDWDL